MKRYGKQVAAVGIGLGLCMAGAAWYASKYNGGRLVAPTDFSTFAPTLKDIPMLAALAAVVLYGLFLVCLLVYALIKAYAKPDTSTHTRRLNPKLGFLGFLGFLGLGGFWSYSADKMIAPFTFLIFFGFFGFFYEGKMSGTFKDERFRENDRRAQLTAYRVGFGMVWLTLMLVGQGGRFGGNLEYVAIAYIIGISLACAVTIFLSRFLLYRYDHDDQADDQPEA